MKGSSSLGGKEPMAVMSFKNRWYNTFSSIGKRNQIQLFFTSGRTKAGKERNPRRMTPAMKQRKKRRQARKKRKKRNRVQRNPRVPRKAGEPKSLRVKSLLMTLLLKSKLRNPSLLKWQGCRLLLHRNRPSQLAACM